MPDSKAIGLVIPTRWEAAGVMGHFKFKRITGNLFRADIHNHSVLLCVSGVGRRLAGAAADRLFASGATELVSMGFCGALVPELHVGDVVTSRIITVDQPARTPGERQALTVRANAVAVDMETQAVIESGTRRGIPIHMLRVVSDELKDDLTPLFGKTGKFSAISIGLHLLNPTVWPLAWKLRKQSLLASARLVSVLDAFCSAPLR